MSYKASEESKRKARPVSSLNQFPAPSRKICIDHSVDDMTIRFSQIRLVSSSYCTGFTQLQVVTYYFLGLCKYGSGGLCGVVRPLQKNSAPATHEIIPMWVYGIPR
jgi:hypothetical protein